MVWFKPIRQRRLRPLDYLVRAQQDRLRDRETECPGGLEIDDKLELNRLLDGQVDRDWNP